MVQLFWSNIAGQPQSTFHVFWLGDWVVPCLLIWSADWWWWKFSIKNKYCPILVERTRTILWATLLGTLPRNVAQKVALCTVCLRAWFRSVSLYSSCPSWPYLPHVQVLSVWMTIHQLMKRRWPLMKLPFIMSPSEHFLVQWSSNKTDSIRSTMSRFQQYHTQPLMKVKHLFLLCCLLQQAASVLTAISSSQVFLRRRNVNYLQSFSEYKPHHV